MSGFSPKLLLEDGAVLLTGVFPLETKANFQI
jgi:hypothetical protein